MMTLIQQMTTATKTTLSHRIRLAAFPVLTALIAVLLFLIPVRSIPGNDMSFQASLFQPVDYVLLATVAALESLLLLMWIHLLQQKRFLSPNRGDIGNGVMGIMSGVPAFLFGAKLCPVCLAGMLGFLGPGAVFFAIEHRLWFFTVSAVILLLSLYSVSQKINGVCTHCVRQERL